MIENKVSDTEISNNGDDAKVLATVIKTMFLFFDKYANHTVVIEGSTNWRTRIYNWLLDRCYDELTQKFIILGLLDNAFVPFEKSKAYKSFEIRLKL